MDTKMTNINRLLKQNNLTPETKRTISILAASAVAEAYIHILPKEGLGMSIIGLVKEGDDVTFYLDITQIESQFTKIFEKQSIVSFIEKYRTRFNKVKKELLDGNLELYPEYFSSMGAIKALTRYVDNSDRFKEYHETMGSLLNEIAEVYSLMETKLPPSQKQSTLHEIRNNIPPTEQENYTLVYDGKEWNKYDDIPEIIIEQTNELKGNGIGDEIVSGRVSLIPKQGSIYVTTMTTPEDTPILDKLKAIVTDEGGMLCHTAVIAREFGVLAVIGTKNATKILKEGDLVEVDATKGIVKIINK